MSRYYTNFSEYPSNAAPPDWVHIWYNGYTWEVRAQADAVGGKVLYNNSSGSNLQCFAWTTPGDTLTDCEILVKLQSSNYNNSGFACLRASNPGNQQGYFVGLGSAGGYAYLYRLSGGTYSTLAAVTYSWQANKWYWIRFKAEGTTLRVRWWQDGEQEPSTWGIEVTDATYASGYVGVGGRFIATRKFDVVGVGTNGDSAPSPPITATFADSVPVAEALAKSARRRLAEVFSLLTSELANTRKTIGDGVDLTDATTPARVLGLLLAEAATISDFVRRLTRRRIPETVQVNETFRKLARMRSCETVVVSESAHRLTGKLLYEPVPAGELNTRRVAKSLPDTVTPSDLTAKRARRPLFDAAVPVDGMIRKTHRFILDAVSSADAAVKRVHRWCADTIVSADAVITQLGRVLFEAAPVAELLRKWTYRSCHDALTPADVLTKRIEKTMGDAIPLFENARHTIGRNLHETLVLADVITRGTAKACMEGLALAENAFTRGLRKVLRLAILLADTQRHKVGKPVSDSLALADANTRRPGKRLVEPLLVAESPRRRICRALFEVVTFADKLRRGYRVALASTLLFADEVLISWRKSRLIRETVSLVEGFHDAWLARARSLPVETVKRAVPVFTDVFQDAVLLVEGFTTKFRRSDRQ